MRSLALIVTLVGSFGIQVKAADDEPAVLVQIAFEEGTPLVDDALREIGTALKEQNIAARIEREPDFDGRWPRNHFEFRPNPAQPTCAAYWFVVSRLDPDEEWAEQQAIQFVIIEAMRAQPAEPGPKVTELEDRSLSVSLGGGGLHVGPSATVQYDPRFRIEGVTTWYVWLDQPEFPAELKLHHWCRTWAKTVASMVALLERQAVEREANRLREAEQWRQVQENFEATQLRSLGLSPSALSRLTAAEKKTLVRYVDSIAEALVTTQRMFAELKALVESKNDADRKELKAALEATSRGPWFLIQGVIEDRP